MWLHKNNNTWYNRCALLFVYSSVGTGFGIAEKDEDISYELRARRWIIFYESNSPFLCSD